MLEISSEIYYIYFVFGILFRAKNFGGFYERFQIKTDTP